MKRYVVILSLFAFPLFSLLTFLQGAIGAPSNSGRVPLVQSELESIVGASEEGSGCRVLIDQTTCATTGNSTAFNYYICRGNPNGDGSGDPDLGQKLTDARDACADYNDGVGDLEVSGGAVLPNTNQFTADETVACFKDYVVTYTETKTIKLGCPAYNNSLNNAYHVKCVPNAGTATINVTRKRCLDP